MSDGAIKREFPRFHGYMVTEAGDVLLIGNGRVQALSIPRPLRAGFYDSDMSFVCAVDDAAPHDLETKRNA